jgi:hypothetical protein
VGNNPLNLVDPNGLCGVDNPFDISASPKFDIYTPNSDPFNNSNFSNSSEIFSNLDNFLTADSYTFPSTEINLKDYNQTSPSGLEEWLKSPFFG